MATRRVSVAAAALLVLMAAGSAHAILDNIVTQWLYTTQQVTRDRGYNNQLGSRLHGFVSVAAYRAAKAANDGKLKNPLLNVELAYSFAAHAVLSRIETVPQSAVFDGKLAAISSKYSKAQLDANEALALPYAIEILKTYAGDTSGTWARFVPSPDNGTIGVYRWAQNQTYTLYPQIANSSTLIFDRTKFPKALGKFLNRAHKVGTPEYNAEYAFLKKYGGVVAPDRSAYDSDTPKFWLAPAGSAGTHGQWHNITLQLLRPDLSVLDTARFFARVGASYNDATVACWWVRFHVLKWRPTTAIRTGDGGLRPSEADPNWLPLLPTVFHPEYPSAHQCVVGSVVGVLYKELGASGITSRPFTINTEWPNIAPRSYKSVDEAQAEAAASRIFAGAHFNQSAYDGYDLGRIIGEYNYANIDKLVYGKQKPAKW